MNNLVFTLICMLRTRDERGATATEYAMLVGGMAVLLLAGVTAFGGDLSGYFKTLFDGLGLGGGPAGG